LSATGFHIETIVSIPFDENTYIATLQGRQDCVVVDPGLEPERILDYLAGRGLEPAVILCTHGHCDHIGGNGRLKEQWPACPLVIGRADAPKLTDPRLNLSAAFGVSITSPPADATVVEGDQYSAAGLELDVLEVPGHSCGHVVFVWRSVTPIRVFGGDVLFQGSVGRTDFPEGDFGLLASGIHRKLFSLPDASIVLPGHGPPTTIGAEKQRNPFVGRPAGYEGD
jgi:glyoxylase-like metal-dependent hydrolase (beta-lactamase superfamily II)